MLVYLSPALVIQAVSNAYLEATFRRLEELIGKDILAVSSADPLTPQADIMLNLKASGMFKRLHTHVEGSGAGLWIDWFSLAVIISTHGGLNQSRPIISLP